MLFQCLRKGFQDQIDGSYPKLSEIEKKMLDKLDAYQNLTGTCFSQRARILDARFQNYFLLGDDIFRMHIVLPISIAQSAPQCVVKKSILEELLDEDSLSGGYEDETSSFLRCTMKNVFQLIPRPCKARMSIFFRYSNLASNMLSIKATSVVFDSIFSDAGNLITAHRTFHSDKSIRALILVLSWTQYLETSWLWLFRIWCACLTLNTLTNYLQTISKENNFTVFEYVGLQQMNNCT